MGGILGGGSSINFMMYTRAQGIDFDSWKTPGWGAKEMLEFSKKAETFHQDEQGIDKSKHGYDGPIQVSDGGYRGKSEHQFLDTIKKMGMKEVVDLQDFDQVDGFSVSMPSNSLQDG
jgi:alcohol oxidase